MKFFQKKSHFHTFDMHNLIRYCVSGVLLICFCISIFKIHITEKSAETIIATTLFSPSPPTQEEVIMSVFSLSTPFLSLSPKEEELPTEVVSIEEATEAFVLPNTAQSITYENAEEKGYKSVDGIYINNQTNKSVDIPSLLNKDLDLSLSSEPNVLIVHTHTTESYTPSALYNYSPTETDRTTDFNYNMASVGEVIANILKEKGINVIHDKTINDNPYSKSYSNSLKLVKAYIEKYPSIKFVIDVHRDAIVTKEGLKMRPVTTFDKSSSQIMLVIGTNESGLNHPSWQTNLSFALKLQHKMNSLYPSLARPINLRRERFNQHTAPYAFILEVGTNGNTLEEAKKGAEYFALSLVSLLQN